MGGTHSSHKLGHSLPQRLLDRSHWALGSCTPWHRRRRWGHHQRGSWRGWRPRYPCRPRSRRRQPRNWSFLHSWLPARSCRSRWGTACPLADTPVPPSGPRSQYHRCISHSRSQSWKLHTLLSRPLGCIPPLYASLQRNPFCSHGTLMLLKCIISPLTWHTLELVSNEPCCVSPCTGAYAPLAATLDAWHFPQRGAVSVSLAKLVAMHWRAR